MTEIKLYNTKTRQKDVFAPIDENDVRMYVCGPTVYDRAHLGNARPVVVFDILFRLLRHKYGHYNVRYVRNFTDVDDKINAKAAETGRDIRDITDETIKWYQDDMAAVGALPPSEEPRATEYIQQMVDMIADLVAKGHAYEAEGHVLFDVNSDPEYGSLSGRNLADMRAGERVEIGDYKRDPLDFVLWKPSTDDLPGWDSPWGRGRPGWHIECSAMALDRFGESFDIHGGGLDLTFPHHENEIAQSRCATPHGGFANFWMHNEMLQVEGKKMSKSLGNFFTVRDLLDQGVPGEVMRFVLLSTHYRSPMDWTEKKMAEATAALRHWHQLVDGFESNGMVDENVVAAIANDLNTSAALARLHQMAKEIANDSGKNCHVQRGIFRASIDLLGLFDGSQADKTVSDDTREIMGQLIARLVDARSVKNWVEADRIKAGMIEAGVKLMVGKDCVIPEITQNFDPAKLESLL